MTIEEAIRNYEESERINTELAENCVSAMAKNHNLDNAEKCRQMIKWLRELQERRKAPEIITCGECLYRELHGIDGFCDHITGEPIMVKKTDYCSWAEKKHVEDS